MEDEFDAWLGHARYERRLRGRTRRRGVGPSAMVPIWAMVIGAFVRGLSMRHIEALCEEAGLGSLSKVTASRICQELRERYEHFKRRDLYDVRVVALSVDAVFLPVRPDGPKEGVLAA